jgi:hypothetical protein
VAQLPRPRLFQGDANKTRGADPLLPCYPGEEDLCHSLCQRSVATRFQEAAMFEGQLQIRWGLRLQDTSVACQLPELPLLARTFA